MRKILEKIAHVQFFAQTVSILIGVAIAYISWNLSIELTIFSSSLFFAYFFIGQRDYLFLLILSYYLFASRGLLIGTQSYYGDFYIALFFWFTASFLITLVWVIIWSPSQKKRLYLFPIMLTILILPPIGFISWVNPLISSAIIFPKLGFLGVALYLLFIYITTLIIKKYKPPLKQFTVLIIALVFTIYSQNMEIQNSQTLHPINSNLVYKNQAIDFMGDYRRQKKLLSIANKNQYNNLLFHENALGVFTKNSMMIWKNLDNNKTILAGATIYKNQNTYDNVLMEITNHSYKTIYKQRVPVPISMWKFWIEQGANAYFFNNPIIEYKKSRVGVFICYEQLLSYTYFHTMLYNPDYIIGISNLWWVEDKSIVKIQKRSLKLWGILFKKDVYYSANR